MSPDFVASIGRAELALNPDFASPLKTPLDEVASSTHHHIPSSTRQQQFQDRVNTNASAEPRHAVFDTDLRSRIGLLYDSVDPFRPPSQQSTPPGVHGDDTPESVSFNKCFRQQQGEDVDEDGAFTAAQNQQHHQQQGSYLPKVKDYSHTFAPEVIDEASLFRILDHTITTKADAFALEECESISHTPTIINTNHGGLSAPASIDRCESSDHLDCGGWPLGSLSLPTSAREAPHSTEDDDDDQEEGKPVDLHLVEEEVVIEVAIEEIDMKQKQQQKQQQHSTMRFTATDVLTSQAVNQLNNGSNFEAGAVAQLLSDGLAMRRTVPATAFMGINNNINNSKKKNSKRNDKMRHSAPAGLPHSDFRRRSSFLSRPPVPSDVLYGLNWLDISCYR